jgi:hypothetical protein
MRRPWSTRAVQPLKEEEKGGEKEEEQEEEDEEKFAPTTQTISVQNYLMNFCELSYRQVHIHN